MQARRGVLPAQLALTQLAHKLGAVRAVRWTRLPGTLLPGTSRWRAHLRDAHLPPTRRQQKGEGRKGTRQQPQAPPPRHRAGLTMFRLRKQSYLRNYGCSRVQPESGLLLVYKFIECKYSDWGAAPNAICQNAVFVHLGNREF